ncbi:MAG TPA: glycosyltransferase, partial [Thermoanaerobaculia bacterium]|nr:glycosyltransferase [Thermoanaerobaculia bacterium]
RVLESRDLAMTPHITRPIDDEATPGERDFLLSGAYNLGFLGIAFNERTLPFLEWWHRRLMRECLHAVDRGLFVDQRWMDLAPSLLERVALLREPGWNVAYWNLVHRRLEKRQDGWWVEGTPLRFFHFSGYQFERPRQISRFQDRLTLEGRPDVAPLFADYRARLFTAGHADLQRHPYAYGAFDNGEEVTPQLRYLLLEVDPRAVRWADPFATTGSDTFYGWLQCSDDAGETVFLPRAAVALWEARGDLRQAFPSLHGASREGFANWLLLSSAEHGLSEEVLGRVRESVRPHPGTLEWRLETMLARVSKSLTDQGFVTCDGLQPADLRALAEEADLDNRQRPILPLLALILHLTRADLRRSFPDPLGGDRSRFAAWFVTFGWYEHALPWALVRPVLSTLGAFRALRALAWMARAALRSGFRRRTARAIRWALEPAASTEPGRRVSGRAPEESAPYGVNVIGWTTAPTGVGEACRNSLVALGEAGVPHAVWSLGSHAFDECKSMARGGSGRQGAPYEVDLLHVNADMMPFVTARLPAWITASRHRIGYWFWELSYFPLSYAPSFAHVDEVWAPTRFCLDAFLPLSPVPVRWMRPAVPPREAAPRSLAEWGVPDGPFVFFFAFDARSVPERKNPRGLIAAFARATARSARPLHLLLKVNHGEESPDLLALLREDARGLPVTMLDATLTRQLIDGMLASCDAFVSLHRSEGLGLPIIEAMQLGRPVIATGYGGCCDFLDDSVGWVVDHTLVPLREAQGPYPQGAVWAEPDLEHAAELMRQVAADAEARRHKAEAARRRVHELYAPAVAGARMRRELDRILAARTAGDARKATEEPPEPGFDEPVGARGRDRRLPAPP